MKPALMRMLGCAAALIGAAPMRRLLAEPAPSVCPHTSRGSGGQQGAPTLDRAVRLRWGSAMIDPPCSAVHARTVDRRQLRT